MIELEGTDRETGEPLHHYISISYPEIYKPDRTTVELDICHVRAAENIRVSYESDRDGWVIERPDMPNYNAETADEMPWIEVAFVQSWIYEDENSENNP